MDFNRIRILDECVPFCVYALDREGRLVFVNKAFEAKTGWTRRELEGLFSPYPFWPESLHQQWAEIQDSPIQGDIVQEGDEIPVQCKNGERFWGMVAKGGLVDDEGNHCGYVFSVFDISRRKWIENEYQQSEGRRGRLFEMLGEAEEKERKRISRELHDSACSSLTAVKFALEQKLRSSKKSIIHYDPEKDVSLENIISMVEHVLGEIRGLSRSLNSEIIESRGLSEALKALCEEFRMIKPDIAVELVLDLKNEYVPNQLGILIYRIVQEAVNNSFKHSGADCVIISLTDVNRIIELSIQDNGKGFDPDAKNGEKTLGLINMKERTTLSGGGFEIEAAPGAGAAVKASWDLESIIPVN